MAPKPAPGKPAQQESSFELSDDVSYGSIDYSDVEVVPPRAAQRPQAISASHSSKPAPVRTEQPISGRSAPNSKQQSSAQRGSSPAAQSYSLTGSIEFSDLSSGTPSGSIDLGDSSGPVQLAGRTSNPQHAATHTSVQALSSRQHSSPANAAHASQAPVNPKLGPPIRKVRSRHSSSAAVVLALRCHTFTLHEYNIQLHRSLGCYALYWHKACSCLPPECIQCLQNIVMS